MTTKAAIQVTSAGDHRYRVRLQDGTVSTVHDVCVPAGLMTELGLASDDEERLVRLSFAFLLEREGPESILNRFDLDVIGRYFPEYVATIGGRLAAP